MGNGVCPMFLAGELKVGWVRKGEKGVGQGVERVCTRFAHGVDRLCAGCGHGADKGGRI